MFAIVFPEIVFRGSFPVWLAIVLMVAIAGLAVAFYFTESMKIGIGRRLVLAGAAGARPLLDRLSAAASRSPSAT